MLGMMWQFIIKASNFQMIRKFSRTNPLLVRLKHISNLLSNSFCFSINSLVREVPHNYKVKIKKIMKRKKLQFMHNRIRKKPLFLMFSLLEKMEADDLSSSCSFWCEVANILHPPAAAHKGQPADDDDACLVVPQGLIESL